VAKKNEGSKSNSVLVGWLVRLPCPLSKIRKKRATLTTTLIRFGCKELVLENKKRTRKGRDTRGEVLNEAEFFEEREKTFGGVPKTRFSLSLL
jgi:hypothetical protein